MSCKYCEASYGNERDLLNNGNDTIMVYQRGESLIMRIASIDGEVRVKSTDIAYCSKCGRKLKDK